MKEFRIYKPNKSGDGVASAWELSYKEKNKYNPWTMFLGVARQTGVDEKGNAQFEWNGETKINIKLGENDIGEILAVLERRKSAVGTGKGLFHQTPGGGNKMISFNKFENGDGYYLKVSAQTDTKNTIGPFGQKITDGEAAILATLLRCAIGKIYGWEGLV